MSNVHLKSTWRRSLTSCASHDPPEERWTCGEIVFIIEKCAFSQQSVRKEKKISRQ